MHAIAHCIWYIAEVMGWALQAPSLSPTIQCNTFLPGQDILQVCHIMAGIVTQQGADWD